MNIVFFLPHLAVGGVERSSFSLAGQLAKTGNRVEILTVGDPDIAHLDLPENVTLKHLGKRRVLTAIPRIARYLSNENIDVLISAQTYVNVAAVLAARLSRSNVKVILTERLAVSASFQDLGSVKRILIRRLMGWLYPKADAIVGNSNAVISDLIDCFGMPPEKCHVIYNAANFEQIRALSESEDETGTTSGKANDGVVKFVSIGRLAHQKDYPTLLRAFRLVRSSYEAELIVVGDGPERTNLERIVSELELERDVSFVGELTNPFKIMKCADVLVLSSLYEGLPNVLIEAQFFGLPIVATDAPGGSREILLDGSAGALVSPSDFEALAAGMIEMITKPDERDIRVANGSNALDRFDPERCATSYLRLIEGQH